MKKLFISFGVMGWKLPIQLAESCSTSKRDKGFFVYDYLIVTSDDYKTWCKKLKPSSIVLMLFFIFVHNKKKGISYYGLNLICKETGLNKRTVMRNIQELECKGFITVERKRKTANKVKISGALLSCISAKMSRNKSTFVTPKEYKEGNIKEVSFEEENYGFIRTN